MIKMELKNLTKEYVTHEGTGTFLAVDHINVVIESGQFVTLLGPSGCGKTTTLRMLAGFESVSEGDILLNGDVVDGPAGQQHGVPKLCAVSPL